MAEDWSRYTRKQDHSGSFRLVIRQACEQAKQAYMKEISLADAAGHAGLSVSHFSALFKQHTGDSYVSYVNRVRIDKAKQLLLEPDLKIYQVAEMVGFVSVPYFTRIFKAIAGQSPNAYRKELGI
ncbi:HTH-type transcriptional regulator YesS [compost metagenome]